jgi:hypothetical protein
MPGTKLVLAGRAKCLRSRHSSPAYMQAGSSRVTCQTPLRGYVKELTENRQFLRPLSSRRSLAKDEPDSTIAWGDNTVNNKSGFVYLTRTGHVLQETCREHPSLAGRVTSLAVPAPVAPGARRACNRTVQNPRHLRANCLSLSNPFNRPFKSVFIRVHPWLKLNRPNSGFRIQLDQQLPIPQNETRPWPERFS